MGSQAIRELIAGRTYKSDDGTWRAFTGRQVDAVMEALEPVMLEYARAIAEARRIIPAEGVWLVEHQPTADRMYRIALLDELPDPVAFASLARHRDTIAQAIAHGLEHRATTPLVIADYVLRALWDAPTEEPDPRSAPTAPQDGLLAQAGK